MRYIIQILLSISIFLAGNVVANHIYNSGHHSWVVVWGFFVAGVIVLVDFCITSHYRSISGGSS